MPAINKLSFTVASFYTTVSATSTSTAAKITRNVIPATLDVRVRRRVPRAPLAIPAYVFPIASRFSYRGPKCFSSSISDRGSYPDKGGSIPESDIPTGVVKPPKKPSETPLTEEQREDTKLLTIPTVLTLGRVAAVPFLIATFYIDSPWAKTATTSIFIAAAITDWLDGYIARKMQLSSAFGAFLDPVADKLMVATTLVLLCTGPMQGGHMPWLLTVPSIAIIGREITISAVREWAASQNSKLLEAVAVSNLGKWKTATQMIALTILLATRDTSLMEPGILVASGVALLYISAGLSLWSLALYMAKIWKALIK